MMFFNLWNSAFPYYKYNYGKNRTEFNESKASELL